ncbi:hypothetical protein cand_011830 [Cryptosporidium andersoni]|uniref:Uncharacterized protein n=1 Tax=Cryptosporidium andersoni TaxID=117008 RepID=A0A1J4MF80_9CRYT|nr:hypothetical protein cand_011830 [Cryptosporidium andersoni]
MDTHSRRTYIPVSSSPEIKVLSYSEVRDTPTIQSPTGKKMRYKNNQSSSSQIYEIFQDKLPVTEKYSPCEKRHYTHEETRINNSASLKKSIIFDPDIGKCVNIYTRRPGCARLKLDLIDYGNSDNDKSISDVYSSEYKVGPNTLNQQHFTGSSPIVIGNIRDDETKKIQAKSSKGSRVNISSISKECGFYMPDKNSCIESHYRTKLIMNSNASKLIFNNGFLVPSVL